MIMNLFFSFTVYSAWDWDFVLLWVVGEKGVFLFFSNHVFSFLLVSISLEGGMYFLSYNIIRKIKRISF